MTSDDYRFMARAIELAERGRYTTQPNPRVGCVVVKDGEIVGEGFHQKAGQPHAERLALQAAGERAKGATAYVSLEPCCHHGKTPPCTEGLIEGGVSRVVAAMEDPNPLVSGRGMALLKEAGIEVESGVLEAQAKALNPGFVSRMTRKRPYVRCKLAMSLDGRTAMANGESQWITGHEARQDVQKLRAGSEAVMTGLGTVLADNPSLNVRLGVEQLGAAEGMVVPQPLRVVLDPQLRMPPESKILQLEGGVLVFCCQGSQENREALEAAGAEIVVVSGEGDALALGEVLGCLADREVNELLIEAGATLAGSALSEGLVDELVLYAAPIIMGSEARGLLNLPGLKRMRDKIGLEMVDLRQVGHDLRLTLKPKNVQA